MEYISIVKYMEVLCTVSNMRNCINSDICCTIQCIIEENSLGLNVALVDNTASSVNLSPDHLASPSTLPLHLDYQSYHDMLFYDYH